MIRHPMTAYIMFRLATWLAVGLPTQKAKIDGTDIGGERVKKLCG